jgi:hypothetical protein
MSKLRTALTIGVVVVAAIGGAAGVAVVYRASPEAARSLAAVDVGVVIALAATVWVLVGPLSKRIDELVEALRALARGDKHTRVDVASFGGLAEIARATNEVGASLCENDDPNLGPVLKRSRDHVVETPQPRRSATETRPPPPPESTLRAPRGAVQEISEHPEIGEVRVRARDTARAASDSEAARPMIDGEGVSEARPARRGSSKKRGGGAASKLPQPAEPSKESAPTTAPTGDAASTAAAATSEQRVAPESESDRAPSSSAASAIPVSLSSEAPTTAEPTTAEPATLEASTTPADQASSTADGAQGAAPSAPASASSPTSPTTSPMADSSTSKSAPGTSDVDEAAAAAPSSSNDTVIEPARPAPVSIPPATNAQLPSRGELEALFKEFAQAKKAAGVDDGLDVDFEAFADTIRGESERLIVEHACRGVRFEVAVAEGEVSLRPRLVR